VNPIAIEHFFPGQLAMMLSDPFLWLILAIFGLLAFLGGKVEEK
jgi:hypothetical protein